MHQYIIDTSFASKGLIDLIGTDSKNYKALLEEQRLALIKEHSVNLQFIQKQMHPSANYWHGLLAEAYADRAEIEDDMKVLEAKIIDKKHSVSALSGALLQLAKQGVSSVSGRPDNCPSGRSIYKIEIKWLIWAARNQSMHYEELKKISDETYNLFSKLNEHEDFCSIPDSRAGINLAYDVVTTLGWLDHDQYIEDMFRLTG